MENLDNMEKPRDSDLVKLEKEVKALKREVSEMKELIRSLLQVIMENSEDDDEEELYTYN